MVSARAGHSKECVDERAGESYASGANSAGVLHNAALMDPLIVFISITAWMILAGVAVRIFRWVPTRVCPLCEAKVELGRTHCQTCGYKFTAARY